MVILTTGGQAFRDAIADELSTGQYGSDNTAENVTDTSLISPTADTQETLQITKSGLTIQAVHDINGTTVGSSTAGEFALQSSAIDLTRATTTEFNIDDTKDIVTTATLTITLN